MPLGSGGALETRLDSLLSHPDSCPTDGVHLIPQVHPTRARPGVLPLLPNLRLVLDVEVHDGNQTAAVHGAPGLWALLDRLAGTAGQHCYGALVAGATKA